jgi:hypothetical protein
MSKKTSPLNKVLERFPAAAGDRNLVKAVQCLLNEEQDFSRRLAEWSLSNNTGGSSETIHAVMMGVKKKGLLWGRIPRDPSDFERCHKLLEVFPEFRARLPEVAKAYPAWKPFVEHWDRLTELYERDFASEEFNEMSRFMQSLTATDRELSKFSIHIVRNFGPDGLRNGFLEEGTGRIGEYERWDANMDRLGIAVKAENFWHLVNRVGRAVVLVPEKFTDRLPAEKPEGIEACSKLVSLKNFEGQKEKFAVLMGEYPIHIPLQGGGTIRIENALVAGLDGVCATPEPSPTTDEGGMQP